MRNYVVYLKGWEDEYGEWHEGQRLFFSDEEYSVEVLEGGVRVVEIMPRLDIAPEIYFWNIRMVDRVDTKNA